MCGSRRLTARGHPGMIQHCWTPCRVSGTDPMVRRVCSVSLNRACSRELFGTAVVGLEWKRAHSAPVTVAVDQVADHPRSWLIFRILPQDRGDARRGARVESAVRRRPRGCAESLSRTNLAPVATFVLSIVFRTFHALTFGEKDLALGALLSKGRPAFRERSTRKAPERLVARRSLSLWRSFLEPFWEGFRRGPGGVDRSGSLA